MRADQHAGSPASRPARLDLELTALVATVTGPALQRDSLVWLDFRGLTLTCDQAEHTHTPTHTVNIGQINGPASLCPEAGQ